MFARLTGVRIPTWKFPCWLKRSKTFYGWWSEKLKYILNLKLIFGSRQSLYFSELQGPNARECDQVSLLVWLIWQADNLQSLKFHAVFVLSRNDCTQLSGFRFMWSIDIVESADAGIISEPNDILEEDIGYLLNRADLQRHREASIRLGIAKVKHFVNMQDDNLESKIVGLANMDGELLKRNFTEIRAESQQQDLDSAGELLSNVRMYYLRENARFN